MHIYAQLDDTNLVVSISQLSGEVVADNMILIDDLDIELDSTYNRATGEFIPPVPQMKIDPQPSIEEKILAENQYQTMLLELTTIGGM